MQIPCSIARHEVSRCEWMADIPGAIVRYRKGKRLLFLDGRKPDTLVGPIEGRGMDVVANGVP